MPFTRVSLRPGYSDAQIAQISDLLQQSLAPRDQRLPDAAAWHKAISGLMADGRLFKVKISVREVIEGEEDQDIQTNG